MKLKDRLIRGLFNVVLDILLLVLVLVLYYFFSVYLSRLSIGFTSLYGEVWLLIIVFALISFFRGLLSGHVLSVPLIIAEALLITYVFISIPSVIQYAEITINIMPIKVFLLGTMLSWYIYSIISELHNSLTMDP